MTEKIDDKLKKIAAADDGRPRKKIAILGAGVAGLTAALELSKLGHQVDVYEAQDRVGGRAWTHRFDDADVPHEERYYHELGAMRFPIHHDYTRHYARICGLSFRPFVSHHDDEDGFYFIKDVLSTHKDFLIKLLPEMNLPETDVQLIVNGPIPDVPQAQHKRLLNLLVFPMHVLTEEILADEADYKALLGLGPITAKVRELDRTSLGDFLASYFSSPATLDLIGAVTGLESFFDKSMTMILREEVVAKGRIKEQQIKPKDEDILEEIIGGTDQLTDKLHEMLHAQGVPVLLKHEVLAINNQRSARNIQLTIRDLDDPQKTTQLLDYEHVICTIPFPVLRRMQLSGVSLGKMKAIRNMGYASSSKVLLYCRERFWEGAKYNIKGGGSQTDQINRQVYYPSDNIKEVVRDKTADSASKSVAASTQTFISKSLKDPDATARPGVLVGSYCWGADARRLGAVPREQRVQVVIDAISHFHPEILEPGMVKAAASICWDEFKWAGGAFCFMGPGDFTNYYYDCIKPEGNLLFAGEHCSLDNGWIQGAIISSLQAVNEVVKK